MRLLASRKQQVSEIYPTKNTRLDINQEKLASLPAILVSRKPTNSGDEKSLFADGLRKEKNRQITLKLTVTPNYSFD